MVTLELRYRSYLFVTLLRGVRQILEAGGFY